MPKTLIFGGAFDPPHSEHVKMCKYAMSALDIDKLVIVPTYLPPHKNAGFLSFDERCALVEAAFDGLDFVIDRIEYERKENNYSSEILPILKQKYADIVYLVGGDSISHFDTWHKPEVVATACPIVALAREGYGDIEAGVENLRQKYGGEFTVIDFEGKDVSSSMIRAKLLLGECAEEIPASVAKTIKRLGLFEDYKQYVERLKSYQSDELFTHSVAVVKRAVDFNSKHHLRQNFKQVFLAALLHDNAKQRPSIDGLTVPADAIGTPVLHQFLGAEKAKRDFGIDDDGVLDAIRYHTTARADMSALEKLIYTADSLSDDRDYEPIPQLRCIAKEDFEKGFLATLEYTYEKLKAKGGNIYPLTLEAYKYYIGDKNK
ncbi:MAG: nicotinate (nicotinamide) nucleotide adenylyltransferase [Bacteroides sp.]|nr:nicotinate (nicotinamide) nucleotide adenylyltransferase [Bacillota bacterium]MCM1393438.1 nicotinate (nicotinamide) nucleotide adenylyltransferase [[Eubacterium] siraeum]MCM1455062.1 nicotinate (nicotinamide) nucleotide adenylyltransferase [Bacteroides sp.]